MLNEHSEIKGLDIRDAMMRMRNNTVLYTRLMGRFLEGAELNALKSSIEARDYKASATNAHTLKGTAANLSAVDIRRLAAEMDLDLKGSSEISDKHVEMLKEIERAYESLREAFSQHMRGS